jgi:P27 family predicted phage terminase small subunit
MPSDMTPEAADLWSEFCPRHEASGNVSDGDATMLAAYCEAVALANRMRDALRVPLVKTTNGGVRVSPAVSVWREAVQTALRIAEHFGWTPLARMRVKADEDPTNEDTAEAGVWSSYTAGSG